MEKKKGKRISYRIVHCSSQDPEYPVTQLLQQSPQSKGWQNKRFSSYPETIVIELVEPSKICKIAVLSHQSKIATKVEFEIKLNDSDDWRKLGRISLDSNVNTNFQARELKQANINDVQARFVRLILRQNHANSQNLFNQVGLIGLSFYGERNDLPPLTDKFQPSKLSQEVDQGTMARIKELQAKKKRAVDNEDYDLAKDIKDEIDRLKSIAVQINSLEERKQEAIRRENYDDAKVINEEIKRLRLGHAPSPPPPGRQPVSKPEPRGYEQEEGPVTGVSPSSNPRAQPSKPVQPIKERRQPPGRSKQQEEERPINVRNPNPYDQPEAEEQEQQEKRDSEAQPLNKQLYEQCSQYFGVLQEQIMRLIFSKVHTNRERGIERVQEELKQTRQREDFIGACLYVVKNLIDDKIASVLLGALGLLTDMLKRLKPQQSSYNQPLVDYILERATDYLGHNNEKIRATAEDAFANCFPMYHLIGKDSCYRALTIQGKRDKPPKILAGRLKVLNKLVVDYQLGPGYEAVIAFAVKYADDKTSEVRAGAISLLCSIAGEIGYAKLQPHLKNLRPPIIKAIEDKLEETGVSNAPASFDEKPAKARGPRGPARGEEMEMEVGNEFIEIPRRSNQQQNEEEYCQFCRRHDPRFVQEDYKDMHYYNACPMLIICGQCGQGVQISSLTSHQVGECQNSKYYKKCPRCKEAVHQKQYKAHVEKKECLPSKPMAAANRCPLCHLDIGAGTQGWKEHLVEQGCENNPRA